MLLRTAFQELFGSGLIWLAENAQAAPRSDSALPYLDFANGTLHEFFYTEHPPLALMLLLASNLRKDVACHKTIFWIGQSIWPTPFGLKQPSADLIPRCVFVDPPTHKLLLWSIETTLRSQAAPLVVAACNQLSFACSRRLTLAAKQGNALGVLLRPIKFSSTPSAAHSRWLIDPTPSQSLNPCFKLRLLKQKGKQPDIFEWIVEMGNHSRGWRDLGSQTKASLPKLLCLRDRFLSPPNRGRLIL